MATTIELPDSLRAFSSQLLPSLRAFIRISAKDTPPFAPWNSAIGGVPYWPKSEPYPSGANGEPLLFLIQINWIETPSLEPFPQQGLLQIFINADEDYGLNFQAPYDQSNFRVIYREKVTDNINELITDFSFLKNEAFGPLSSRTSFGLDFSISEEFIPRENYRFDQLLGSDFFTQFGDQTWEVSQEYWKVASGMGHKIGGYPFFTQQDPRTEEQPLTLLLQLDSDVKMQLAWGDIGVANFFIHPDDLEANDFSKVYYNWDCY